MLMNLYKDHHAENINLHRISTSLQH